MKFSEGESEIQKKSNLNENGDVKDESNKVNEHENEKEEEMNSIDDNQSPESAHEMIYNLNYNAHIFYYAWYSNPKTDGKYRHWNHKLIPHWNPSIDRQYPKGIHSPPDDIGGMLNFLYSFFRFASINLI